MSARSCAAALAALVLLGASDASAACRFRASTGWASSATGGTAELTAGRGDSCTATIFADPGNNLAAASLAIDAAPAHGVLTVSGGTFTYKADAAFTGSDRFALSGQGRTAAGGVVRLKGTVTVTVDR
ncbi:MAG: Ig-like domain-containing protein [Bauldia sp.]